MTSHSRGSLDDSQELFSVDEFHGDDTIEFVVKIPFTGFLKLGMAMLASHSCIRSSRGEEPFFSNHEDPKRIVIEGHAIEVWPCGCITILGNYCAGEEDSD